MQSPRNSPQDPGLTVVPDTDTDPFDTFWKLYPKKVGKPQCRSLWDRITNGGLTTKSMHKDSGTYLKLKLNATPAEIIAGAEKYRATQMMADGWQIKDEGRYVAHPATWLNQGRWMDFE